MGAFLLCGKPGCSGGKSNGTVLLTGKFSGKKEYLQKYSPFLGFTGIIGISPYHLRHHTSTMPFDELRGLSVEKLYCSIWLKILTLPFDLAGKFLPFFHSNGKRSMKVDIDHHDG